MHTDANNTPVTVGDSVLLDDYWAKRHAQKCVLVAKHKFGPLWVAERPDGEAIKQFLISKNDFVKEG